MAFLNHQMRKIFIVAGARPNFMKVAPLLRAFARMRHFCPLLVHTGQHYDFSMSDVFFHDLDIPKPDIFLGVGSGTHGRQTARILTAFEKTLIAERPALVVVVGDVNSAMACALAAAKLQIKIAHVEAGLRSFDRDMPEEINRIVTDRLSNLLFVSEESGLRNLKREGVAHGKIFHVGNVMIDSLANSLSVIRRSPILKRLGLTGKPYGVVTLHRPSNVDDAATLRRILRILEAACGQTTMVFPVHPRTRKKIQAHGLLARFAKLKKLMTTDPLGYTDFMRLVQASRFVLTDSGGIQEETTFLKVPCMTMRLNTERPSTVQIGSNVLVGNDRDLILDGIGRALSGDWKRSGIPRFWDGKAAVRIAKILEKSFSVY